ncbi:MAG TPA: AI-2E family transporter [Acidimicrobiales bacterium]|nr:AI-2E family transporter [Acidimicrobiales bacterium]
MAQPDHTSQANREDGIYPVVARLGAYSWWLIGSGIVVLAVLWLMSRLWVLVLAAAVAALLSRALDAPARYLRARGLPRALVAASVLLGFIVVLAGIAALLVPSIANEFDDLGPTIEDAIDDVENWLVEDSPFDVSRKDVQDFRDQANERIGDLLQSQSGTLISGTILVFEAFAGIVLALVTTFFILKDGDRFGDWFVARFPRQRRNLVSRLGARAWRTLGGYLRGSATLGLIEGFIIGTTVWLVGGSLAIPVAVITFFAAFIPFAGALIAGVIAILVTLVTAGFSGAVVVAIVALVVQQLDNDLLAPLVFGRNLELHPLVVLVAITAGGTLFGAFGAFLAVPVSAVLINILAESRVVPEELAVDGSTGEPRGDDPEAG